MSALADRSGLHRAGRPALAARIGLALVAAAQAEVGVWGLIAPRAFYRDFPGAGHHWVSALGPYNEHLVRDYAATELGFAVLLALAALWFQRRLVVASAIAFIAATLPHFIYHLTTTGSLATTDNLASLGAFAVELVLIGLVMLSVARVPNPERST